MAPKPTEVKLLIKHLESEAPDVETLAKTILTELDAKRQAEAEKDPPYALLFRDPNTRNVYVYGPYKTEAQARKDLSKLVSPGPEPAQARISRLRGVRDDV